MKNLFELTIPPPLKVGIRHLSLPLTILSATVCASTWVEKSFEDFIDGNVGPGLYVSHRTMLEPDSGCVEFSIRFDTNNDGYFDLVTSCFGSGQNYYRVYFGCSNGFPQDSVRLYSLSSGAGDACFADLDCDFHPEMVTGGWGNPLKIYWGTPTGPSSTNMTVLPNRKSEGVYPADFNRDGWLDIAISSGNDQGGYGDSLYIFWGTPSGYSSTNYTSFATTGGCAHNLEAADLDKDGWLDVVVVSNWGGPNSVIYSPGNSARRTDLDFVNGTQYGQGVAIADLNGDSWIDIVFTGTADVNESYIYWGSASGFTSKIVVSPGPCFGGSAAADFNNDGLVDILYFKGSYPGSSYFPVIYLNQGSCPHFSDSDTVLVGDRRLCSTGGFIADFNFDGVLDIFINNFTSNYSYVLYGPGYVNCDSIYHSNKDHHGTFMEAGNTYTREYVTQYVSSVFDASDTLCKLTADWTAYEPGGSEIRVEIRAGCTSTPDTLWTGWLPIQREDTISNTAGLGRYFQYRAEFIYGSPCKLPWLERIEIGMWQPIGIEEETNHQLSTGNRQLSVHPNPATHNTVVKFVVHGSGFVDEKPLTIRIHDLSGRLIRSLNLCNLDQSVKSVVWDGKDNLSHKVQPGVYFYTCELRMESGTTRKSGKLVMMER